jgi:hypothetical protein
MSRPRTLTLPLQERSRALQMCMSRRKDSKCSLLPDGEHPYEWRRFIGGARTVSDLSQLLILRVRIDRDFPHFGCNHLIARTA